MMYRININKTQPTNNQLNMVEVEAYNHNDSQFTDLLFECDPNVSKYEYNVLMSNVKVLRCALQQGSALQSSASSPYIVVMSDDMIALDDFNKKLDEELSKLPDDWEVVVLSYGCTERDNQLKILSCDDYTEYKTGMCSNIAYCMKRSVASTMVEEYYNDVLEQYIFDRKVSFENIFYEKNRTYVLKRALMRCSQSNVGEQFRESVEKYFSNRKVVVS